MQVPANPGSLLGDGSNVLLKIGVIAVAALLLLVFAKSTIKIAKEYERGVVFRLGRLISLKRPGMFMIAPFGIDHVRIVDLRVITLEVPQH